MTPMDQADQAWWLKPPAADAAGLSGGEAAARLAEFGPNLFREHQTQSLLAQFLSRFRNPLVIILLAASAIADSITREPPPTAFETGTRRFGLLIMRFTVLLVLFVLLVNALLHRPWLESFLFAVALAVGLTPELLPIEQFFRDRPQESARLRDQYHALESDGFRVLGIAWREVAADHPHAVVSDETELVFAGFAAFLDPAKESAGAALAALKASGVATWSAIWGTGSTMRRRCIRQTSVCRWIRRSTLPRKQPTSFCSSTI